MNFRSHSVENRQIRCDITTDLLRFVPGARCIEWLIILPVEMQVHRVRAYTKKLETLADKLMHKKDVARQRTRSEDLLKVVRLVK